MLQNTYFAVNNFLVIVEFPIPPRTFQSLHDRSGMNWGDRNRFPFTFVMVRSSRRWKIFTTWRVNL